MEKKKIRTLEIKIGRNIGEEDKNIGEVDRNIGEVDRNIGEVEWNIGMETMLGTFGGNIIRCS